MTIEFTIPLTASTLVSEANRGGEHWVKKGQRHRTQHLLINAFMNKAESQLEGKTWKDFLPIKITLTRIAPRLLDAHDNLPMSLKYFVDAIADKMIPGQKKGMADSNENLTWIYKQKQGKVKEYALIVQLELS